MVCVGNSAEASLGRCSVVSGSVVVLLRDDVINGCFELFVNGYDNLLCHAMKACGVDSQVVRHSAQAKKGFRSLAALLRSRVTTCLLIILLTDSWPASALCVCEKLAVALLKSQHVIVTSLVC